MEALHWVGANWFEIAQTAGIIGGQGFAAYVFWKDTEARRISNLIALKQENREIWREPYYRPELFRVLQKDVDLKEKPVTNDEWLFVKTLILHLDTVRRAMRSGMFITLEGLSSDVRDFFSSPVPKAVWEKLKPFQDREYVNFIETMLR